MRRSAVVIVLCCIVALLPAAAVAAGGKSVYVGKTGQGRQIRLTASSESLLLGSFSIKLNCKDGSVLIDQESGFEPTPVNGGKFVETQFGATDKVTYKGAIRGSKVIGTLKVRDTVGKVFCVSPTVKFTATRR